MRLSDGSLRNAYTVRILNKSLEQRTFVLSVAGPPEADIDVIGGAGFSGGFPLVQIGADQSREFRALVTVRDPTVPHASIPIVFTIVPKDGGHAATASDHFFGP